MLGTARWLAVVGAMMLVVAASAQTPADMPRDHWAYDAVQDLASKGLIKGYPPDGNFFGKRTVTRYEMATLVGRVLAHITEQIGARADVNRTQAPASQVVDARALADIRKLVDELKIELGVIGADLPEVKKQIGEFRQELDTTKQTADKAAAAAESAETKAQAVRDEIPDIIEAIQLQRSEFDGLSKDFKGHKLSGYLQARYESFDTGQTSLFPAVGSTGGPAVGGPSQGFLIRRARLKFGGQYTTRTNYALQLDVPSTGAVAVKDAYINIGDLPLPDRAVLSVGLLAPPFGVEFPASSSVRESPERAGGFSDSSASFSVFKGVKGMFDGQDRDVGMLMSYSLPNYTNPKTIVMAGVFNGEGRAAGGARNQNSQLDAVVRAQTTLLNGHLDLGVSGYYGAIAVKQQSADAAPTRNAYRLLGGADLRYFAPWGTVLRAEYVGGLYEVTPDRSLYLEGNHAQAWLLSIRHPVGRRLELVAKYDEFDPVSQSGFTVSGLGRMQLARKVLGAGLLYQIDEATRFRLWYAKGLTPYDPTASSGPKRDRLGLITSEIQLTY